MIASLQRATSLLLVAAVLGWLAWSRTEPWAIQLLGTLILLASHSLALAAQFALLTWIHGDDPAPRASILLRLQAWLQESIVAARVFLWEQPWQVNRHPDQVGGGAAACGLKSGTERPRSEAGGRARRNAGGHYRWAARDCIKRGWRHTAAAAGDAEPWLRRGG